MDQKSMSERIGWEKITGHKAHLVIVRNGKVRTLCTQTRVHVGRDSGQLQTIPTNACLKCSELSGERA